MHAMKATPWEASLKLTAVVLAALALVAMAVATISNSLRIAAIESSRFTNTDGTKLERRVFDRLPPAWLTDRVNALAADHAAFDRRLDALEKRD